MRGLLSAAADRLRRAEVASPDSDARQLMAHVLAVEPGRLLLLDDVPQPQQDAFQALVDRRAARIPLQHLTGWAYFRHEQISVGPGVFVPRPETEVMAGWAIDQLRALELSPDEIVVGSRSKRSTPALVVELCAGSGAISKSITSEVPAVSVHAVEVSEQAAEWAAKNLAGTGVQLHVEDMAGALHDLDATVDLVIANPPYIPLDAYLSVAVEARDHDPTVALFSGGDGLDAIRIVAEVAARLLRDGGLVCIEHAEVQAESAPAILTGHGDFAVVRDHRDLADRPRFVTAERRPRAESR
jgi:release factor glutamine methyltransferase